MGLSPVPFLLPPSHRPAWGSLSALPVLDREALFLQMRFGDEPEASGGGLRPFASPPHLFSVILSHLGPQGWSAWTCQ